MAEGLAVLFMLIYFGLVAILVVSMWVIYKKAAKPGWASIVPIYNMLVLLQIVGRPWWWMLVPFAMGILLLAVPMLFPLVLLVLIAMSVILYHDLAVSFGEGWGYTFGLLFLYPIFLPMLAFGEATYKGPAAKAA